MEAALGEGGGRSWLFGENGRAIAPQPYLARIFSELYLEFLTFLCGPADFHVLPDHRQVMRRVAVSYAAIHCCLGRLSLGRNNT